MLLQKSSVSQPVVIMLPVALEVVSGDAQGTSRPLPPGKETRHAVQKAAGKGAF